MDDTQKTFPKNLTTWFTRSGLNSEERTDDVPSSSLLNILVYRVTGHWGSVHWGSHNFASVFTKRGFVEQTGFSPKQWLLVIAEMVLSFCWWVIRTRRSDVNDLNERNITERQELIDQYFRRGCSSILSLLLGYIADTYVKIYPVAIFNVSLHFLLCTALFMEIMIRDGDYALYTGFFFQSVGILMIPLKATDFARTVYALQIFGRKNLKIALLFIFYAAWFSDRALGGVMVLIVRLINVRWESKVQLSFLASGIAMGVYIYVFKPSKDRFVPSHGHVGNDFIGCIVTALRTRHRLKGRPKEKTMHWLDYAEIKYERGLITRARDLLRLYILILPTIGFSLYATPRCDFYAVVWQHLIPTGLFKKTGIEAGVAFVTIIAMGAMQLIVMAMQHIVGWTRFKSFLSRYIVGYISALLCIAYTAALLNSLEATYPSPIRGMVRILNVRDDDVTVKSDQTDITSFDQKLKSKNDLRFSLYIPHNTLIRVQLIFNETNFTSHIAMEPNRLIGYVLFEPANILRMGYEIPIRELRAGKNNPMMPKVYIFNSMEVNVTVEFRNATLGVYPFKVTPGKLLLDQLPEGRYELRTLEFESNGAQNITMEAGGIYGIVSHESSLETLMTADTVIKGKRVNSLYIVPTQILYGIAITLAYVSLRGMVFYNTPEGMEGLSFGFLEYVDNAAYYIIWVGYRDLHPFITSFTLLVYATIEVLLMCTSCAIFIKYSNWYKFKL